MSPRGREVAASVGAVVLVLVVTLCLAP